MDRQVVHITRLVDDLLDVSRVSRGKIQLQTRGVDLRLPVQQAVETCSQFMDARRHTLQVSLPDEPVYVQGDLMRLSQVIANLLNNAAKYTDEGGVIRVGLQACPDNLQEAMISVAENGRGIDPQSMDLLFDLFYQADHNLDRSDGCLGIGLSLARSLVELHHGRILVHSSGPGKGSEFQIFLPGMAQPESRTPDSIEYLAMPRDGNLKVLVVDDTRDSARSMGMLLKSLRCTVSIAFDRQEAVDTAMREGPDVILMDIGLPKMSGYQACRSMRERGLTDQLIIAVAGYGQDDDRRRCREAGFDDHMVKPIGLSDLQKLLFQQELALTERRNIVG